MTPTTDALQRAIDYLGAVEVAPGRYAWHCYGLTGTYFIGDKTAVLNQGPHASNIPGTVRLMPEWWSPTRQTIERCPHNRLAQEACADAECGMGSNQSEWYKVTVSLETGEEVRGDA